MFEWAYFFILKYFITVIWVVLYFFLIELAYTFKCIIINWLTFFRCSVSQFDCNCETVLLPSSVKWFRRNKSWNFGKLIQQVKLERGEVLISPLFRIKSAFLKWIMCSWGELPFFQDILAYINRAISNIFAKWFSTLTCMWHVKSKEVTTCEHNVLVTLIFLTLLCKHSTTGHLAMSLQRIIVE